MRSHSIFRQEIEPPKIREQRTSRTSGGYHARLSNKLIQFEKTAYADGRSVNPAERWQQIRNGLDEVRNNRQNIQEFSIVKANDESTQKPQQRPVLQRISPLERGLNRTIFASRFENNSPSVSENNQPTVLKSVVNSEKKMSIQELDVRTQPRTVVISRNSEQNSSMATSEGDIPSLTTRFNKSVDKIQEEVVLRSNQLMDNQQQSETVKIMAENPSKIELQKSIERIEKMLNQIGTVTI